MFVSHAVWIDVLDGKLKGTALRVLSFVAARVDMRNRCYWTQSAVAEEMGLSRQAASKAFRELVELGYVFRVREPEGMRIWMLDARRMYRGAGSRHRTIVERQAKLREGIEVSEREEAALDRAEAFDADPEEAMCMYGSPSDDELRAWENNRGEPVPA